MLVLGNQDRKGLQGHEVQSSATCPFRGFQPVRICVQHCPLARVVFFLPSLVLTLWCFYEHKFHYLVTSVLNTCGDGNQIWFAEET